MEWVRESSIHMLFQCTIYYKPAWIGLNSEGRGTKVTKRIPKYLNLELIGPDHKHTRVI